jgi:hypothetical protein
MSIKIYNKTATLATKDKYCTDNIEIEVVSSNLTPENIVKGKNILGVIGTAEGGSTPTPDGTIYDNSIILNGEAYTIDRTKPVLTDAVIIANPYKAEPERITVTITPTLGKVSTKKEGTFGTFYYHNRFYFDILPEGVGSSCRVNITYNLGSNGGTPFAAIGKLDTITETGSKTADYIVTKNEYYESGYTRSCNYTFTDLTEGRHFIDTQVISPTGPYLTVNVTWEIVEE